MKILKLILWLIVIVIVGYALLCFAGPKAMETTATKSIKGSPAVVFSQVADFSKWSSWSPWARKDSTMKPDITGNPGEVDHKMSWKSEVADVGTGTQRIVEIRQNEFIRSEIAFEGMGDPFYASMKFTPNGDSTTVVWTMEPSEMPFYIRGFAVLVGFKQSITNDYNNGLNYLAEVVATLPADNAVEQNFVIEDHQDQWYLGKMLKGVSLADDNQAALQKMFDEGYKEIQAFMKGAGVSPAGPYMSIAHNYSEAQHTADLELSVPVSDSLDTKGNITCGKIPGGKAARYEHIGGYSDLADAWGKFMGSLMASHTPRWSGYEVYVVDPAAQPDSTKWITHLVQPVQ